MKKILTSSFIVLSLALVACGGKDDKKTTEDQKKTESTEVVKDTPNETPKETAASIAQQWCELNGKAFKATGADKETAVKNRKDFEDNMQKKFGDNKTFMDEIGVEVEKCEDASEGK